MIQLPVQSGPFFSNDAIGLAKLVTFGGAILTPVLAVVYRLTFNGTRKEMGELKKDLNGYGERLNQMALDQRGLQTEIGSMNKEVQKVAVLLARLEERLSMMKQE